MLVQFQSPSLRGSGRFRREAAARAEAEEHVSIPFIAGQWSLQAEEQARREAAARVSIPFIAGQWSLPQLRRAGWKQPLLLKKDSFNPLHCGAVVASPSHNAPLVLRRPAAEFATSLRPRSLGVLAQVA
jgi:hypothetical protein